MSKRKFTPTTQFGAKSSKMEVFGFNMFGQLGNGERRAKRAVSNTWSQAAHSVSLQVVVTT